MDCSYTMRRTLLLALLLGAATIASYWTVAKCDFINFDDPEYVSENDSVTQGLSWKSIGWALRTGHAGNWHPLTWISHMVDVQLFGLRPGWHHFVNLLFHCANTSLLFLVLSRL